jgi:hypothetical protein
MTQLQKEQMAPNYWNVVNLWNINPNDKQLEELESKLTREEKTYFEFHKEAKKVTEILNK